MDEKSEVLLEEELSWTANGGTTCSIMYLPEIDRIATGSYDDSLRIWNMNELIAQSNPIYSVCPKEEFRENFPYDTNAVIRYDFLFPAMVGDGTVHAYSTDPPFSKLRVFDFKLIFDRPPMGSPSKRKLWFKDNFETDEFAILTDQGGGEIAVMSYSGHKLVHHHEKIGVTIAGYSNILQSKSIPNSLFLNSSYGYSISETTDNRQVFLIDYISGKIIKEYNKHTLTVFGMDSYMTRLNREILVGGGNDKTVFLYDVMTTNVLRKIKTVGIVSCFLRLGMNHMLIGEGNHNLEIIELSNFTHIGDGIDLVKISDLEEEKPFFSHKLGASNFFVEEFCLMSNLDRGMFEGEIRIGLASAENSVFVMRIRNLEICLEHGHGLQEEDDLKERLEYLFFNETRYIGKSESFEISICQRIVIKHEILRYFL